MERTPPGTLQQKETSLSSCVVITCSLLRSNERDPMENTRIGYCRQYSSIPPITIVLATQSGARLAMTF